MLKFPLFDQIVLIRPGFLQPDHHSGLSSSTSCRAATIFASSPSTAINDPQDVLNVGATGLIDLSSMGFVGDLKCSGKCQGVATFFCRSS